MQIKDYITKNLPSLNWNILPQIFEENEVELTEEIEAYLRNTPENTNWNVVGSLSGSGNSDGSTQRLVVFEGTITTEYNEARMSAQTIVNGSIPTSLTKCFVTYNGVEYILPYDNVMRGYGKSTFSDQGMPICAFDDFPCYVWPQTVDLSKIMILTSSNTTCTVKIEIENPISDEYGTLLLYEVINCLIDNDGSYGGSGKTILSLDTIPEQITVIFDEVVYQNITNHSYADSFGIYGDLESIPFNIQLMSNSPCGLDAVSRSTHLVTVYYTP